MWYIHEYFKTQREALRYAADKMPANQAKRVEQLSKFDGLYREGFRWTVEVRRTSGA